MKRSFALSLSIAVGVGLGVGGVRLLEPRLPTSPVVRGLRMDGHEVGPDSDLRALVQQRGAAMARRTVTLRSGAHRFEARFVDLGLTVDVDRTVAAAQQVGHHGSLARRWRQTQDARHGEIDVDLVWSIDEQVIREFVAQYVDTMRVEPVDARLDLAGHRKISDTPGEALDVEATTAEIAAALVAELDGSSPQLGMVVAPLSADVTLHDLEDIDVSKVLASFDTKFAPFKKNRSHNVMRAAQQLDGLIIRPGQTVSFNKHVGERTPERGYKMAPVIVGDELTQGWGGGTCQVSSTLHGAALYGGLDIVQRRSHSRPSSYTKLGLDATVSYPQVDLKVRNPFPFTVAVHTSFPQPGVLRVEVLGGTEVEDVEYKYGVARVEGFTRRITVKSWLKSGRAFRKQKGTRGMDVFSYVTVRYRDGRVVEKKYYSGYRATPEVFWVPEDYQREELPDLPKWAKGYEGELGHDGSDVYSSL